jgi:hypothetical protein
MQATNEGTGHTRTIKLTGIPDIGKGLLTELTITVNYTQEPNDGRVLDKAVTLDSVVIPEIIRAINNCGQLDGFFRGVTGPVV